MRDILHHPMRPILAVLLLLALAAPAQAALNVCNKTARPVRVAVGRFNGTDWASEGWWTLVAKQCAAVVAGRLDARYYYVFATDDGPGSWGGNRGFCVASADRFSVVGRDDCAGRGYERKGFFAVDTGQATDYTQSISD
jgi:uncharacterized membrane protein